MKVMTTKENSSHRFVVYEKRFEPKRPTSSPHLLCGVFHVGVIFLDFKIKGFGLKKKDGTPPEV